MHHLHATRAATRASSAWSSSRPTSSPSSARASSAASTTCSAAPSRRSTASNPRDLHIAELVARVERRRRGGHRGHQPDDDRRGHGHVHRRPAARAACASRAWPAGCRSAATWNMQTSSRSAAPCPGAATVRACGSAVTRRHGRRSTTRRATMQGLTEIRWHGRGGQGAVTAAKMVAELALGQEQVLPGLPRVRPGALRRAHRRLHARQRRAHPDLRRGSSTRRSSSCSTPPCSSIVDVTKGAPDDAIVLVNSEMPPAELRTKYHIKGHRLYTIAATRIAIETIGRPIPNTPMVGALTRITGLFPHRQRRRVPARGLRQEVPAQGRRGQHQGHHALLRGGPGRMTVEKKAGSQEAGRQRAEEDRKAAKQPSCPSPSGTSATSTSGAPTAHELGATIPEAGNSVYNETGGWRTHGAGHRQREMRRLHALLLLLPRRLHHHRERQGGRRRPGPLQGLRHLRQGVPAGGHRHEDRREGVSEVATARSQHPRSHRQRGGRRGHAPDQPGRGRPPTPSRRRPRSCRSTPSSWPTARSTREFVTVESEHSAMSAVIGSAAGGARTMTATCSQGFALMWEMLFVAASLPAADRHDHRQPRPLRPHQHPLRPLRHHGRPRQRLDPALRREPPGGLRQPHPGGAHRRAHGRAPAGHDACTTATSSAAPSARCRCCPTTRCRSSSAPTSADQPACSTPSTRSRWARSTACTAGTSSTRWRRTAPWTAP